MSRSYKNFRGEENNDHYFRSERRKSKMKQQDTEVAKSYATDYTEFLKYKEEEGYGLGYDSGYYSKD